MTHDETVAARKQASLIGVCKAVGEGLGFNPDFLRIGLAISLIVKPEYTLIVYGILAVTVLASRVLVRAPRGAKIVRQPEQAEAAAEPMRAAA
ncbi:MAG: PspC domain-containing protein [Sphingomonas oligoaromativorans]